MFERKNKKITCEIQRKCTTIHSIMFVNMLFFTTCFNISRVQTQITKQITKQKPVLKNISIILLILQMNDFGHKKPP